MVTQIDDAVPAVEDEDCVASLAEGMVEVLEAVKVVEADEDGDDKDVELGRLEVLLVILAVPVIGSTALVSRIGEDDAVTVAVRVRVNVPGVKVGMS